MKLHALALRACALLALAVSVAAVQAHDDKNEKKKVAGPNGGRILAQVEPRAEFFVRPDRKVQITFLDKAGKSVAPVEQTVTVIAGERSAPQTLAFTKAGNALVSSAPLPSGDSVPTVVQIKPAPGGKTATEKFNVDVSKCGECKLAEYACICGH